MLIRDIKMRDRDFEDKTIQSYFYKHLSPEIPKYGDIVFHDIEKAQAFADAHPGHQHRIVIILFDPASGTDATFSGSIQAANSGQPD